jgi:hypothetical protein
MQQKLVTFFVSIKLLLSDRNMFDSSEDVRTRRGGRREKEVEGLMRNRRDANV